MWVANRAAAMQGLAKLPKDEDVAILVLDTRDEVGGKIAARAAEVEKTDLASYERKILGKGMIPTAILILERRVASKVMGFSSPRCAANLLSPAPHGGIWVVVVANGGSSMLLTERAPLHSRGDA